MAISDKLNYLIETKSQLKDMINYGLDDDNKITSTTTFRNYVSSVFEAFLESLNNPSTLFNNLPKITGSGSNITLNDTANAPMRITLSPSELEQDTTTGKNLCTGASKLSNTLISFTMSKAIEKTITLSFNTNETLASNTMYFMIDNVQNTIGTITGSGRVVKTITLTDELYNSIQNSTSFDLRIYKGGATFETPTEAQIEKGNTATSFEPYTGGIPAPNPQYPQDIHTISGSNTIKVLGENYFHISSVTPVSSYYMTYEKINDNKIIITLNNSGVSYRYVTIPVELEANTTYYFKAKTTSTNSNMTNLWLGVNSGDGSTTLYNNPYTSEREISFNTGANTTIKVFLYTNGSEQGENTATWENIQLTKTSGASFTPYVSQEQEVDLKSENLFDGEIELGSINPADGTLATNNARTRSKNFIKVKPNTTYSISRQFGQNRWIIGYTSSKVGITDGNVGGYASALLQMTYGVVTSRFTTSATTEYIKWYDTNLTVLTEKVMINEGSTALEYVPYYDFNYSKMPNTNYKDQFIRTSGKNLFDKDNANVLNAYLTVSQNNIMSSTVDRIVWIFCKPNTTYSISKILQTTNNRFSIATTIETPAIGVQKYNQINTFTTSTYTYTTDSNANYLVLFCYTNTSSNTLDEVLDSIMINEGTTALPYEPYGSNEWYIKDKIPKYVFDGTENWVSSQYGTNSWALDYVLKIDYDTSKVQIMSNVFKGISNDDRATGGDNTIYTYSNNGIIIRNTALTTLADVQNATSGNYVYYVSSIPTYTKITGTLAEQLEYVYQLLKSYKGVTNISQVNNDLPFELNVSALESI